MGVKTVNYWDLLDVKQIKRERVGKMDTRLGAGVDVSRARWYYECALERLGIIDAANGNDEGFD